MNYSIRGKRPRSNTLYWSNMLECPNVAIVAYKKEQDESTLSELLEYRYLINNQYCIVPKNMVLWIHGKEKKLLFHPTEPTIEQELSIETLALLLLAEYTEQRGSLFFYIFHIEFHFYSVDPLSDMLCLLLVITFPLPNISKRQVLTLIYFSYHHPTA